MQLENENKLQTINNVKNSVEIMEKKITVSCYFVTEAQQFPA